MNSVQHASNNRVLGAPSGWDQQSLPCDALAVTDAKLGDVACIVSFWKPTPEELAALNAGGFVALHVMGRNMPPVAIGVQA